MPVLSPVSPLQNAIDTVESLDLQDREVLVKVISKRLIHARRAELIRDVSESEEAFARGDVRRGSVADLMAEVY